jgi:hypothetical protein
VARPSWRVCVLTAPARSRCGVVGWPHLRLQAALRLSTVAPAPAQAALRLPSLMCYKPSMPACGVAFLYATE